MNMIELNKLNVSFQITFIVAISMVLGFACANKENIASNTNTNNTVIPTPTPIPLDPFEILDKSGQLMQDLKSFRFQMTHNKGGTQFLPGVVIEEVTGSVVYPDSMAISFNGVFGNTIAIEVGLVTTREGSYMTSPLTGIWQEVESGLNPLAFFNPSSGISSIMTNLQNVQLMESNLENHYKISGNLDAKQLEPLIGSTLENSVVAVELIVNVSNLLMSNAELSGKVTEFDIEGIIRTINITDFNDSIVIEKPDN